MQAESSFHSQEQPVNINKVQTESNQACFNVQCLMFNV
jgi:hypothetical protein